MNKYIHITIPMAQSFCCEAKLYKETVGLWSAVFKPCDKCKHEKQD